jgi:hypothetical protein
VVRRSPTSHDALAFGKVGGRLGGR